jgi:hypothetical protein
MTEGGRGTRGLRIPSTIEVSAAQSGRAGRPPLRFARRMRHDQLLSGYPVVVICRRRLRDHSIC